VSAGRPGAAILLGIILGLTEFLPISSSGHLAAAEILFPSLAFPGVTLELATHLGTTAAVILYYRRLIATLLGWRGGEDALLGLSRMRWIVLLAVGSLPTAIIGFLLRDTVRAAFDRPLWVAVGWAITGLVLFLTRGHERGDRSIAWPIAVLVGTVQGLAVFPGVSRSGTTISAALVPGILPSQAVTFSFFLSIPAILGAALLDAVQTAPESVGAALLFPDLLFASLAAGFVGYICIGLVHRATGRGWWHHFAWYCWLAALVLVAAAR